MEVYGRHKRGVAYNHQGQRVGRPHVATWADTATVLAADLLAGNDDPRRDAAELLYRALAALPAAAAVAVTRRYGFRTVVVGARGGRLRDDPSVGVPRRYSAPGRPRPG